MLVCNAYIWAFLCAYTVMRVCKKMVIYLGIKRKYTWQKNARISCRRNDCKYKWEKTTRISCHNFETNGRPYLFGLTNKATWPKSLTSGAKINRPACLRIRSLPVGSKRHEKIWAREHGKGGSGGLPLPISRRLIYGFALSQFRGSDCLGAWN